jgi:hypothetical protein
MKLLPYLEPPPYPLVYPPGQHMATSFTPAAKDEEPNPDEVQAIQDGVYKTIDDLRLDVDR